MNVIDANLIFVFQDEMVFALLTFAAMQVRWIMNGVRDDICDFAGFTIEEISKMFETRKDMKPTKYTSSYDYFVCYHSGSHRHARAAIFEKLPAKIQELEGGNGKEIYREYARLLKDPQSETYKEIMGTIFSPQCMVRLDCDHYAHIPTITSISVLRILLGRIPNEVERRALSTLLTAFQARLDIPERYAAAQTSWARKLHTGVGIQEGFDVAYLLNGPPDPNVDVAAKSTTATFVGTSASTSSPKRASQHHPKDTIDRGSPSNKSTSVRGRKEGPRDRK